MPVNINHYELNPILTWGEVFDLIFHETLSFTFSTIEDAKAYDDILAGFHDLVKRNIIAGVIRVAVISGEPMFCREEIFRWFASKNVLEYYKNKNIPISKDVFALVNKYGDTKGKLENNDLGSVEIVRGIRVWNENMVEIRIQQPGKKPITHTPSSLGFDNPKTREWKALLEILKDGEFCFKKDEDAKKSMYLRIEKKIIKSFKAQFGLYIPDGFKIFHSVSGGKGIRKPIFKIDKSRTDTDINDYCGYGKPQIMKEIKMLSLSTNLDCIPNLQKAVDHAKSLGIKDSELQVEMSINEELYNLDAQSSLDQDRPNITGKRHNPVFDEDFTEES
jgi:hypothetical protein